MVDATPLLRLYARWRLARLARQDAAATQERMLRRLVRRARDTRFGRDHHFAGIESVADFQQRVPLRSYDAFWTEYWKHGFPVLTDVSWPGTIPYFAVSSGTSTGVTKYIPNTTALLRANTRAGLDVLSHHVAARPDSRVLGGKALMLGGSTALKELAPGIYSGDLSGIAAKRLPAWARRFQFPPLDVALMEDWDAKVERIAHLSARTDLRIVTGTPSWLLILFRRHADLLKRDVPRAAHLYPKLDLLVHGGVNFAPYRARFEAFLEGSRAELREVYPASEGFIACADAGPFDGLRLLLDNGLFFEFVPVQELNADRPTRHWIKTVETGVNYALVLSNCAGAFGYVIGDTVRFVSLDPPRLVITGRTSYALSAFGEHLIGEEIEAAVARAADAIGRSVTDFSVGAVFPAEGETAGYHRYVVEFADGIPDRTRLARFLQVLDDTLRAENEDYEADRARGIIKAPMLWVVPPESFKAWMKARGRLGGQNKVPRVINDQALFQSLQDSVAGSAMIL